MVFLPRRVLAVALPACAALAVACAHQSEPKTAEVPRDRTLLDSTELLDRGYPNTFAAVNSARPEWLRPPVAPPVQRGGDPSGRTQRFPTAAQVDRVSNASAGTIGVFVEGTKQAMGISYLNSLPTASVAVLKHLSASEAMSMYGPEWAYGAIVVRLRQ